MIRHALLAVLAALSLGGAATAAEAETVTIAVRTDARPFAWQAADDSGTFGGYLVDICIDATTRAGYHFDQVPIDAGERSALLGGNFALRGRSVDLLCDPTTITLARLDWLAGQPQTQHAVFSPILFVANGSYVRNKKADACVVAAGDDGAAAEGDKAEADKDEEGRCDPKSKLGVDRDGLLSDQNCFVPEGQEPSKATKYLVAGFVEGSTARGVIERAMRKTNLGLGEDETLCLFEAPSHTKGIELLCRGALHFYFGDTDIIEAYRSRQAGSCEIDRPKAPLSYEPYALLVPSTDPAFRARFVAAVYEIFTDGTAAGRFAHHFQGLGMSTALRMLFRINSIPGLRPAARGADPECRMCKAGSP